MKIVSISTVIAMFAVLLTGCFGDSPPTESDARSVFENQLGKEFKDGTIKINSFKKINGLSREYSGIKIYTLEYEAEIEYPNGLNTQCISKDGRFMGWGCWQVKTAEIGKKIKENAEISFTMTENGWKGEDKNIY